MPFKDESTSREYKNTWRREQRKARGLQKAGRKPLSEEQRVASQNARRVWEKVWMKEYRDHHPAKRLLWAAKRRAKDHGLDFDLLEEDIVIPTHCPYLKIPLVNSRPRGSERRDIASLDRKDPSKGYTKDNIEVISWLANTMKNNATPELLLEFAKEVLKRYA